MNGIDRTTFHAAKSAALTAWGGEIYLKKLVETGLSQDEAYHGRGYDLQRELKKRQLVAQMLQVLGKKNDRTGKKNDHTVTDEKNLSKDEAKKGTKQKQAKQVRTFT